MEEAYRNRREEEEEEKLSSGKVGGWLLEKGTSICKGIVVSGCVITTAPLLLPPLLVGLACSLPYAFFLAAYTSTQSLMSILLPCPDAEGDTTAGGYSAIQLYDEGDKGGDDSNVELCPGTYGEVLIPTHGNEKFHEETPLLVEEMEVNGDFVGGVEEEEEEEVVAGTTGLLEKIRDEFNDDTGEELIKDDNNVPVDYANGGASEDIIDADNEDKDVVRIDATRTFDELRVELPRENELQQTEGDHNQYPVNEAEGVPSLNADANETNGDVESPQLRSQQHHELSGDIVGSDGSSELNIPSIVATDAVAKPAEVPSGEDSGSNEVKEATWRTINAVRDIVGYKGNRQERCIEEVKALYLFAGIEPPASFSYSSDLTEVNEKLKFLMAIVGIK